MRLNEYERIVGSRCILVPYREHHVPKYHGWMQSEELLEATVSERLTFEEELSMQKSWQSDEDKLTFIILDRKKYEQTQNEVDSMAGDINGFFISAEEFTCGEDDNYAFDVKNNRSDERKCVELSVMIELRYRDLAMEAIALVIQYVNAKLLLRDFVAKINGDNSGSVLFFEKVHFHRLKFDKAFQCFTMKFDFQNCFDRLVDMFKYQIQRYPC